jgi:hypothetical protein
MHWIRMWGLSDEEVCLFVLFVPWCGGFAARVSRGSLWTRSFLSGNTVFSKGKTVQYETKFEFSMNGFYVFSVWRFKFE